MGYRSETAGKIGWTPELIKEPRSQGAKEPRSQELGVRVRPRALVFEESLVQLLPGGGSFLSDLHFPLPPEVLSPVSLASWLLRSLAPWLL